MKLKLDSIRTDGGTQTRAVIDQNTVAQYSDDMRAGAAFPPIVVFHDGAEYWLADGFHRVMAATAAGLSEVDSDVKQGTRRDAVLFSVGANARHGLRRTNEDKRRAVETLLNDAEWRKWSNVKIAEACGVSNQFVSTMRQPLHVASSNDGRIEPVKYERNGKTFEMVPARAKSEEPQLVGNVHTVNFFAGGMTLSPELRKEVSDSYELQSPRKSDAVTLADWRTKSKAERSQLLGVRGAQKFNTQETDNIEWARWSWNPVTGCKHNCPYCYARDIANRFYPHGFEPAIVPSRLAAPGNTTVPDAAKTDIGYKNVFTCSMADLFGRWVPAEWIEAVLDQVRANKQWNFLFLTKFPGRLAEFQFPDNAWVGTSVDCQARVAAAEAAFRNVKAAVKWLSCEPLLEPLRFNSLSMFQWIVIGGSSKSTQTPAWNPPRQWVASLESHAWNCGVKVYEKTNLTFDRVREYPGTETERAKLPEQLKYMPTMGD